jgi:ketosteroid isomerase-like protein
MKSALEIVQRYWELMASNDFASVAEVLSEDLVLEWPQSNERIRGAERFARVNSEYPAHGRWRFKLDRIVASGEEAVTDVRVSDGVVNARAISFFELRDGRIARIVEYWPEPFLPATDRAHLTESIA